MLNGRPWIIPEVAFWNCPQFSNLVEWEEYQILLSVKMKVDQRIDYSECVSMQM